jgi:5'-3' exonuclease
MNANSLFRKKSKMGVPSYFFWLVKKFEEQILKQIEQNQIPEKERPDNLFLDWNCGIHPAIKKPHLDTLESKIEAVIEYMDKIFELVRPRKLFYVAIDGVAPRAKMQQQRKRRFKSVQDAIYTKRLMEKHGILPTSTVITCNDPGSQYRPDPIADDLGLGIADLSSGELEAECCPNLVLTKEQQEWDYNMISPGTVFMELLSKRIKEYLSKKNTTNEKCQGPKCKIIFSDSSVPGEGEHKIMQYIREETGFADKNMIYGLDSDLIFLSLINFRPGTSLLREQVEFGDKFKVSQLINTIKTKGAIPIEGEQSSKLDAKPVGWAVLSVDALREIFLKIFNPYLSIRDLENFNIFGTKLLDECMNQFYKEDSFPDYVELMMREQFYHEPDIEGKNIIIDYIFISFMLGNDFLPPIVSLQIKEGGLDHLIRAYKITLITMRQNLILLETGSASTNKSNSINHFQQAQHFRINLPFFIRLLEICTSFETVILKQSSRNKHFRISNFKKSKRWLSAGAYEKDMLDLDYVEDKVDDYIRLGEPGWRSRYYDVHFHLKDRNEYESRKYIMGICEHYMRGMIWTLQYYLTGKPDWTWEYPFHSAPTVQDFLDYVKSPSNNMYRIYRELAVAGGNNKSIDPQTERKGQTVPQSERVTRPDRVTRTETVTRPVAPLEQLMCILPPASSHLLPTPIQEIMKSERLGVYYPQDFALDVFGCRFRWEAHPLLPTIPASEVSAAVKSVEPYLSPEELERNSVGKPIVFP